MNKPFLPLGWSRQPLDHIVDIANGQVDPRNEPYLSMLHIGSENIESDTGRIINISTCKNLGLISGKYEYDEHAILYSKIRPHLNKACLPQFKGVCSADIYPLWPKNSDLLEKKYLFYFLLSQFFLKRAVAASMRTGMPKINREELGMIEISLPPLLEQQKIARILSTWDTVIDCTQKLLENSRQQKKVLIQQLLTGKKRLSGFSGKWDWHLMGDIAKPCREKNNAGKNLPVLACSKYFGFVDSLSYFKKQVFSEDTSSYKIIRRGEFGYPANHIEEGAIGYQNLYDTALVSPIYVIFKLKPNVNGDFLYHVLKTDAYRQIFSAATSASVDRRGSLRWPGFAKVKVKLPSIEEQIAIVEALSSCGAIIAQYEAKLVSLQTQKKALMQQLLTGKRRVKLDEPADTPAA